MQTNSTSYTVPQIQENTWYYLVYVRDSGNNATVYLNGTRSTSGVQTDNYTYANSNLIGCWNQNQDLIPDNFFSGYLSNLCITSVALFNPSTYSTIPIPTAPFTLNSNTLLLLNTTSLTVPFIDSSPNDFTMTGVGTPGPQISNTGPF